MSMDPYSVTEWRFLTEQRAFRKMVKADPIAGWILYRVLWDYSGAFRSEVFRTWDTEDDLIMQLRIWTTLPLDTIRNSLPKVWESGLAKFQDGTLYIFGSKKKHATPRYSKWHETASRKADNYNATEENLTSDDTPCHEMTDNAKPWKKSGTNGTEQNGTELNGTYKEQERVCEVVDTQYNDPQTVIQDRDCSVHLHPSQEKSKEPEKYLSGRGDIDRCIRKYYEGLNKKGFGKNAILMCIRQDTGISEEASKLLNGMEPQRACEYIYDTFMNAKDCGAYLAKMLRDKPDLAGTATYDAVKAILFGGNGKRKSSEPQHVADVAAQLERGMAMLDGSP